MDNSTLDGPEAVVAAEVHTIKNQRALKGLYRNEKYEAISLEDHVTDRTLQQFIEL